MSSVPLIRIPENPVPEGLRVEYLKASDGGKLRYAHLPALPDGEARGTFLVHPGWSEFLEKYFEVAMDLRKRGFNVALVDPRGQGYSQRFMRGDNRGLITDFSRFSDDFDTSMAKVQADFPGPYFILAHSMGGLITLDWLTSRRPADIRGAVLSAPMTRIFASPVRRAIVHQIVRSAVMLGLARRQLSAAPEHSMNFETNVLTQDPRRHERFRLLQLRAPEAMAGRPRYAWLNAAMAATARFAKPDALSSLPLHVLLVSADWDDTVDPTHHRILAKGCENIILKRIEDARHEILMEKDEYRDQFWAAFDEYVVARLDPTVDVKRFEGSQPGTSPVARV